MAKALKRILLFGVLPLLLLGGLLAWCERDVVLTWYYLRGLENARGDDVATWAARTASLDAPVVPRVLELLTRDDEAVCANAHAALSALGQRWGRTAPHSGELVQQAVKLFPRLSQPGRGVVLKLTEDWAGCEETCPECLVCAGSHLLVQVAHLHQPALLGPTVELALTIVAHSSRPELTSAARGIAQAALAADDPAVRARALRLATHPGIELRGEVVKRLHDPEPLVRRAAMLAVSEDDEAIANDNLMAWLHDPDAEVRRLCEAALRGPKRGLKPHHLQLARLIGDARWEVRLRVLDHLEDAQDLDPSGWLRLLTQDRSPPVRAAAIRAAAHFDGVDLSDRLSQMADKDPDSTVAELARHYLSQARP